MKNEKVELKAESVSFSGTRGSDDAKFAVNLELFAPIDPEACKVSVGHREVSLVLKKAETGPYWPRLLKSPQKMHFIHTDFSKWKDEDEEDEADDFDAQNFGQFGRFNNFEQFGDFGGAEEEEEEAVEDEEENVVEEEEDKVDEEAALN